MKEQILSLLNQKYGQAHGATIEEETPLLSSGLVDSVSALELVDDLESTFGFEFAPHEVDQANLDSAVKIEAFISAKLNT